MGYASNALLEGRKNGGEMESSTTYQAPKSLTHTLWDGLGGQDSTTVANAATVR